MQRRFMIKTLAAILAGAAFALGGNASPSTDALTGLPLYPGVTDPSPMPKMSVCRKPMQGYFYIVMGEKVDAVADWYAKHLPTYKKYHSFVDDRSVDTFWSPDGTLQVTVTGSPKSSEVYAISYGRVTPGLLAPEMASFNTGKQVCK